MEWGILINFILNSFFKWYWFAERFVSRKPTAHIYFLPFPIFPCVFKFQLKWNIPWKARQLQQQHILSFWQIFDKLLLHWSAIVLELIFFYYGYCVSVEQSKKNKKKLLLAERRRWDKRTPPGFLLSAMMLNPIQVPVELQKWPSLLVVLLCCWSKSPLQLATVWTCL